MYTRTFVSNIDECRLEAEISDEAGIIVAVLYEGKMGRHVDFPDNNSHVKPPDEFIEVVQREMSGFINRTGANAPEGLTRAGLALWLMQKEDGTAMGLVIG